MDDPSQMHHNCTMKEQEEIWICHYEEAKEIEERAHKKLEVYLEDSWLKYLLHLVKVDETSAYLMYKNFEQKQNQDDQTRML